MQYEASEAFMARDWAEARLAKLFEEFKSLQVEHTELQEDHSILKEDQRQLKEKYSMTLEGLKASQASVIEAEKGKVVVKEKFKHFQGLYKKTKLQLNEAKAKVADYPHQLSLSSRVQDSAWADGLHLEFKTFRTWWKDPARKMDLNLIQIKDIPCTGKAIWWLTSLAQEEMLDTAGIAEFDYHPQANDSKAASEGGEAKEAFEDDEATPTAQDPLLLP